MTSSAPLPPAPPPVPPVQPAPPVRASDAPDAVAAPGFWRQGLTRLSGGPGRLGGLDVARGLAVLGMFVAHLYSPDPATGVDPIPWSWVLDGRSSILFATLAGVSLAIMSGRTRPLDGVPALQARMRILVRAVLVFTIGELLTMLGTPVAVILQAYAVLFVLALPFLRWPARRLFVLAGASALVLPFLTPIVAATLVWAQLSPVPLTDLLVTGTYPGMVWFTFVVLGLAIGRCELDRLRVQAGLVGAGLTLATLTYATATVLGTSALASALGNSDGGEAEAAPGFFVLPGLTAVARTAQAHSGGLAEVVGSGALAAAVIGACLVAARWVWWPLVPVAAVGSMALSAYSAHLIALWRIGDEYWYRMGAGLLGSFVLVTVAGCTLWRFFLGRGPLERVLTLVSWRAAGIPRTAPPGSAPTNAAPTGSAPTNAAPPGSAQSVT